MIKPSKLKFLVVDDDEATRDMNTKILQYLYQGCSVETLENGEEFVNYQESAHVYIVDNRMPEINGLEALTQRRARGDQTPAIIATGTPQDLENKPLPANTRVLKKPYEIPQFKASIDALISEHYK